jgi:mono/diheme cytochrome c family protein
VACHQANGLGTPGQFPPLAESDWVNEAEPGRMIRIVLNGLQGPITVKGQNYNNVMVSWNMLSDDDIAAVITFVRQNREWGNKASAVTPEQVKAVRAKVKGRTTAYTPDELLKISPAE